jgi:cold shock CspA family protein
MAQDLCVGSIRWYNQEKKYGFIIDVAIRREGELDKPIPNFGDVFFHYNNGKFPIINKNGVVIFGNKLNADGERLVEPEVGDDIIFYLESSPKGFRASAWCFQDLWDEALDEATLQNVADDGWESDMEESMPANEDTCWFCPMCGTKMVPDENGLNCPVCEYDGSY